MAITTTHFITQLKARLHNGLLSRLLGTFLQNIVNGVASVEFTVGAEADNAITVNCQAKDLLGNDIAEVTNFKLLVMADAGGLAFNTTNYTSIAAGTDGAALELVADKVLECTTEADGDLDIVLTLSSGGATSYLIAVGPTGRIIGTSEAITHAA